MTQVFGIMWQGNATEPAQFCQVHNGKYRGPEFLSIEEAKREAKRWSDEARENFWPCRYAAAIVPVDMRLYPES